MIAAGTHKVKLINHGVTLTKDGNPQVVCTFETEGSKINWYGSFKERALPHTIKSLILLGLEGNNPAGALQIGKEVEIVVEQMIDQMGKPRFSVRYINPIGGIMNVLTPDMAKAKLKALEGAVVAARQTTSSSTKDDQIPF